MTTPRLDLDMDYSPEEIEKKISRALAQADRGESISGDEAFRRLREHAAARARTSSPPPPDRQGG